MITPNVENIPDVTFPFVSIQSCSPIISESLNCNHSWCDISESSKLKSFMTWHFPLFSLIHICSCMIPNYYGHAQSFVSGLYAFPHGIVSFCLSPSNCRFGSLPVQLLNGSSFYSVPLFSLAKCVEPRPSNLTPSKLGVIWVPAPVSVEQVFTR